MDSAQGCDLAPLFRDLSQSEKLSEIEPPYGRSESLKVSFVPRPWDQDKA